MKESNKCNCEVCPVCSGIDNSKDISDESGVMIVEVLDPNKDEILYDLEKNLPPMENIEVVLASLQELKVSSGIIKIAAKHKPNNPKLWARCLADARKRFKVCPSAYCNAFAAKTYKKKGGTWRTVKGKSK
jgi:hypothetical protein